MNSSPEQLKNNNIKNNNNNKTLYDLVVAQGFDFKKVVPYIAESFGICTKDQYVSARGTPKNFEYNKKIRNKILGGAQISIPHLKDNVINQFSSEKQDVLKQQFGLLQHGGFVSYINGLEVNQIEQLNKLPKEKFQSFISQQANESKNIVIGKEGMSQLAIEQIKNINQLTMFKEKMRIFIKDNKLEKVKLSTKQEVEQEFDKLSPEIKQQYANAFVTDVYIKEKIKQDLDYKKLSQSNELKKLSPEKQQEFNNILVEYYTYNESIGLGDELKEIWGEELYLSIQKISANQIKEGNNSDIDGIKNDIVSNNDITEYFKKNQKENLVNEKDKDISYYAGLRKLYPEVDKLITQDKKIQQLMNIKKPTEKEKIELEKRIQEKSKVSEVNLNTDTNEVIQQQAVAGCLDMLKIYMDIDISEQENVLDKLSLNTKDLIKKDGEDIILDIHGTINGKKITLYYNLNKGTIQQEEFLTRDNINTPFSINNPIGGKKDVAGIQLPKFKDFVVGAENIDYKNLIQTSADINEYKKNMANELKSQVKKEGIWDVDTEKNIFKKTVFQNIVAQEMFGFLGKDIHMSPETFTLNQNLEVYGMYNVFYNTLHYYNTDQLKRLRTCIPKLTIQKGKYIENTKKKGDNNEKYLLGLLGSQTTTDSQKLTTTNPYALLNNYASFFSVFKTTEANMQIIDLAVLEKFTTRCGDEVSKDQSYLDEKDMELNFKKTISGMENNIEIADLEKKFENLNV